MFHSSTTTPRSVSITITIRYLFTDSALIGYNYKPTDQ